MSFSTQKNSMTNFKSESTFHVYVVFLGLKGQSRQFLTIIFSHKTISFGPQHDYRWCLYRGSCSLTIPWCSIHAGESFLGYPPKKIQIPFSVASVFNIDSPVTHAQGSQSISNSNVSQKPETIIPLDSKVHLKLPSEAYEWKKNLRSNISWHWPFKVK